VIAGVSQNSLNSIFTSPKRNSNGGAAIDNILSVSLSLSLPLFIPLSCVCIKWKVDKSTFDHFFALIPADSFVRAFFERGFSVFFSSAPATMPARLCEYRSRAKEPPRSLTHRYFSSRGGTTSCPPVDTEKGGLKDISESSLHSSVKCAPEIMRWPIRAICALLPSLVFSTSSAQPAISRYHTTPAICPGVPPAASPPNLPAFS